MLVTKPLANLKIYLVMKAYPAVCKIHNRTPQLNRTALYLCAYLYNTYLCSFLSEVLEARRELRAIEGHCDSWKWPSRVIRWDKEGVAGRNERNKCSPRWGVFKLSFGQIYQKSKKFNDFFHKKTIGKNALVFRPAEGGWRFFSTACANGTGVLFARASMVRPQWPHHGLTLPDTTTVLTEKYIKRLGNSVFFWISLLGCASSGH